MWQCSYYDEPFKNVFLLFQDFFGSREIFHTYCSSNKMITHSFFSSLSKGEAWLKPSVTEQNCCEGMAAPFQTLPGLGKTPAAVRCRAKYCVSWVREQHVERRGHTCFCTEKYTVGIHTHVCIYRYTYTLLIHSTHQTSSLCSGGCSANRLSMGRKRKDPLYVVANVNSFQWYATQRFRFLSQTSLCDNF